MGKCIVFVDGENLLLRFQSMKDAGRKMRTGAHQYEFHRHLGQVIHSQDRYVWNPSIVREVADGPLARVNYYTTFQGSTDDLEALETQISGLKAHLILGHHGGVDTLMPNATGLVPKVFKKQSRGKKTKSVDINICVDVLTQAYQGAVDDIYIVSGDGDYAPLIEQVMRTGKRVHVAALSDGLSPVMRRISDHFVLLDEVMFESDRGSF